MHKHGGKYLKDEKTTTYKYGGNYMNVGFATTT